MQLFFALLPRALRVGTVSTGYTILQLSDDWIDQKNIYAHNIYNLHWTLN